MTGFARGMNAQKITKLEDEAEDVAVRLAGDVDLPKKVRDKTMSSRLGKNLCWNVV